MIAEISSADSIIDTLSTSLDDEQKFAAKERRKYLSQIISSSMTGTKNTHKPLDGKVGGRVSTDTDGNVRVEVYGEITWGGSDNKTSDRSRDRSSDDNSSDRSRNDPDDRSHKCIIHA